MNKAIGVIDAGFGNVGSVSNALEFLGQSVILVDTYETLNTHKVDALILPGVGSFHTAMHKLCEVNLDEAIRGAAINQNLPVLGICLGAQLLFDTGEEGIRTNGLGLISGEVRGLRPRAAGGMRVPHTGWNTVTLLEEWAAVINTDSVDLYFNHSFVVEPADALTVRAFCDYSERFVAGYQHQDIWGFQFHPEKSQSQGLSLLRHFLDSV